MKRITTLIAVATVLATAYAATMTVLLARNDETHIEYERLFFCRNFASVVKDHRRDARSHLDADLTPRDAWGDYLVRERGTIELALDVCFPGLDIAPFRIEGAPEPALASYLRWLEALELMIWRTS